MHGPLLGYVAAGIFCGPALRARANLRFCVMAPAGRSVAVALFRRPRKLGVSLGIMCRPAFARCVAQLRERGMRGPAASLEPRAVLRHGQVGRDCTAPCESKESEHFTASPFIVQRKYRSPYSAASRRGVWQWAAICVGQGSRPDSAADRSVSTGPSRFERAYHCALGRA